MKTLLHMVIICWQLAKNMKLVDQVRYASACSSILLFHNLPVCCATGYPLFWGCDWTEIPLRYKTGADKGSLERKCLLWHLNNLILVALMWSMKSCHRRRRSMSYMLCSLLHIIVHTKTHVTSQWRYSSSISLLSTLTFIEKHLHECLFCK